METNLFTRERLESAVNALTGRRQTFSSVLSEARNYSYASSGQKTIFLSHSHHDARYVHVTRKFFENLGIGIYVDWADDSMPKETCGETAEKIKTKILMNDKFVLLATNLALMSKWCNWEVGIGDTFKLKEDNIVILPLVDNIGEWKGNEYLQIYPYIKGPERDYMISSPYNYNVRYPNGNEVPLVQWLLK